MSDRNNGFTDKRELELKFLAGRLKKLPPGFKLRIDLKAQIEQIYLQRGWRIRKSVFPIEIPKKPPVFELNKKTLTGQSRSGVDNRESEGPIPEELYEDLALDWADSKMAPIHKVRRVIETEGFLVQFDRFDEGWVLDGAEYLVEVEYDPHEDSPEGIQAIVEQAFNGIRNVSGDSRYRNNEIARRIAACKPNAVIR